MVKDSARLGRGEDERNARMGLVALFSTTAVLVTECPEVKCRPKDRTDCSSPSFKGYGAQNRQ